MRKMGNLKTFASDDTVGVEHKQCSLNKMCSNEKRPTWKTSPTYSMTKHTLDSKRETLSKLLWTLDCTLVRLIEEILNSGGQTTDDAERIAKDVETEYKYIHLLQCLTTHITIMIFDATYYVTVIPGDN